MRIFYRITSNLVSSTSINTDFAETEVDARQINLTGFAVISFDVSSSSKIRIFELPRVQERSPVLPRRIDRGWRRCRSCQGETHRKEAASISVQDVKTRDSGIAPGRNIVGRVKTNFGHSLISAPL
jgi:hypothetical protein